MSDLALSSGWENYELSELTTKIIDGTHHTPTYTTQGIPFLRVTDIQTSNIDFEKIKYIPEKEHKELLRRCNPEVGDLLLSKNGTIGLVKIIDWNWECSLFVSLALIKPKKDLIDAVYLKHIINSDVVWQQIHRRAKQGTVTNLHLEEIREFNIPLPPKWQQQKIANILSTADNLIEKTQTLIDKYTSIKQGMMADLFTRGIDLSNGPDGTPASNPNYGQLRPSVEDAPELYKETELGWVPKEWEVKSLGEFAEKVTSGSRDWAAYYADEGDLFVRISNLTREHINFRWDSIKYVDIGGGSEGERTRLEEGDILISITADLGIIGVVPKDFGRAFINQHTALVRILDEVVNSRFVGQFFQSHAGKQQFEMLNDSGAKAGLNLPTIASLLCIQPSAQEQENINNKIDAIDKLIADYKIERDKFISQKKGLMQDLLTGKVQVA